MMRKSMAARTLMVAAGNANCPSMAATALKSRDDVQIVNVKADGLQVIFRSADAAKNEHARVGEAVAKACA